MEKSAFGWEQVLEPHLAPALRRRLRGARVGIAGAGGLGSNCAVMLARSGIGGLVIADHDMVSVSNLNRQQYLPEQVGLPKVEALAALLTALNPELRLETRRERLDGALACALFADCSVVVEAVDDAATKRMLTESLLAAGHTVIAASGMGGWGGPPMTERRALINSLYFQHCPIL